MQKQSFWRTWVIGDRRFYRTACALMLPIVIQHTVETFVGLLDNVMIGQIGTEPMSGVAIVGQLMQVFNICVYGAMAAPNIFGAQFHGARDAEGIRATFRFKLWEMLGLMALGLVAFIGYGTPLIRLYLTGGGAEAEAALDYARQYLDVMLWGLAPFALSVAYTGTLASTGETRIPMIAGVAAVLVNLAGNYVLIFGHFGAGRSGRGAGHGDLPLHGAGGGGGLCPRPCGAVSVPARCVPQPVRSEGSGPAHGAQERAAAGQ